MLAATLPEVALACEILLGLRPLFYRGIEMVLSVQHLFEQDGASETFEFALDLSVETFHGAKPFTKPMTVKGRVENKVGMVCLAYTIDCLLAIPCDRCLEPAFLAETYAFSHLLVKASGTEAEAKAQGANDDAIFIEQDRLDLSDLAMTDLLLSLPHKFLCDKDCAGLCMICGQNQNSAPCDCNNKKVVDPRLAVLSTLLESE